ncbi:malto-oligosyltrehalose synthase [Microbacterium thalassium]|uniref:(1->4)-alpha-D-glucan 1-alpha-D-glucosylmutase n=1 Tax=Microbacterium thalassium TaxID=362649 RepID=A0A7X0KVD7_9MICO|nr:malto-oligosyltrehalose synthase [Microbacterium thalassium]MBB6392130.1 (1->4)-alpha-D-glucan 1-alpha-D-glucosylmutase [Microbacterium thalassium]GLK24911.1 malto-oligosyltrehalose synthase [Microbacterium thalassium]
MTPASTYRLQIRPGFDLDAAADVAGYLRDLGAGWAYLSPLLASASGSEHGYDVVDTSTVDAARGGPDALSRFAGAARASGLGILVDIVPNHMGVARPRENAWWWDVLERGRASRFAGAFDIDWEYGGGRLRLPVLGAPLDEAVADIGIDAEAGVARYFDLEFPLASGTFDDVPAGGAADRDQVLAVLARQHWQVVYWREAETALNYRRFFTVTGLAGLRVEVPWVFEAAHAEVLRWMRDGLADGLRIDHPDGLADPGRYLETLAAATGGAYVVVEKILEHAATDHPERLPPWWETDGTTGYDAMAEIDRVLVDPAGEGPLAALDERLGSQAAPAWAELIHGTKRTIADTEQHAEVLRLVRCLDVPVPHAQDALAELLACYPVYRSYLPAGVDHLEHAATEATRRRPDLAGTIARLVPLLGDADGELARRFQQTTGPVMAKGVEDTGFYRWTRLGTLTEVGGDPSVFSLSVAGLHRAFERRQSAWPRTLTALTTHDTKRSEDVRARLSVLAELPQQWADSLERLRSVASCGDGRFDALVWQAVIGAWPLTPERLHAYVEKAARESGAHTDWLAPDEAFERRLHGVVDAAFGEARAEVEGFVASIRTHGWSNSLAAKLIQLAGPGVPDVYQGTELWDLSLVDPDNRRPVDFARRRELLARIDGGWIPPVDDTGAAKLLVTSRVLRARRDRPELFERYTPMEVVGAAAGHAVAFDRGGALAVATRLPAGLAARGGWGDTTLLRHSGPTVDAFTGRVFEGSAVAVADVLATYPVALLLPA